LFFCPFPKRTASSAALRDIVIVNTTYRLPMVLLETLEGGKIRFSSKSTTNVRFGSAANAS